MAMEFLAGDTLAQRLRATGAMPVQESLRLLRQIARGLREAHKLGAVHRDLKPSNVILVAEEDGGEVVKILDFGIGKLMDDGDQELTQEGAFLGSPKYIAPEQVNERRVDARTDVYALGVIAFECLTGSVPFEGESNLETILAHTSRPVPRMAERSRAVVPEIVEAFVRRCLEKEPADRPQSMEEVLRTISECERHLFGSTSLGAMPSGSGSMAVPHPGLGRTSDAGTLALQPAALASVRPSMGTASPLTRSEASPAPAGPGRMLLVVVTVVALGAAAAIAATRFVGRPSATAAAPPQPAPTATAPARSFTLVLDSTPSGADVLDGDDILGTTPMQVTVDRTTVRDGPRRFVLRLDGYAPYTVLQGDSDGIVHVTAPLEAAGVVAPSATASSPPPQQRAPRWTPPPRTTATQRPPQDTDIKLQR
jgi:eukaryotic-like serine/threonine-protein kinase